MLLWPRYEAHYNDIFTFMNTLVSKRDLALVGAGYWGKNLARCFHGLGVLRSLCDRSRTILGSYGADYIEVEKTDSFDAVLQDVEVRKVVIATPAALHYTLAKAALLAGKDVLVEKPLCLEPAEAAELGDIAARDGRVLMVGHLLQYHPCVREMQRIVAAGELGQLQYLTSNRLNLGKIRQEENSLWSFAPHDISVMLSLTGNLLPWRIRCTGESYLTPKVADTTLTTLQFAGGVRGHVFVSWLNPFKEQKLTVVGSRGMLVFDDTKPWGEKLVIHRDHVTWSEGRTPVPARNQGQLVVVPEKEPLRQECEHFLECCVKRTPPRTDALEGLRVLQVLHAAQRSLDQDGEAVSPVTDVAPSYSAHPSAVIGKGAKIGRGSKIWHFSHVMDGAVLGEKCSLGQNVVISPGVVLGANVKVQNNVSVYAGTTVEDDVFLGPSCVLTNVSNPRSQVARQKLYEKTLIRRGATVGANATIVCGVTLGRYCFVAAGAVVTRDVPDYALVVGSPARPRGWMSRHGHVLSQPDSDGVMTCPESGLRYHLSPAGGPNQVDSRESGPASEALRCLDLPEDESLPPAQSVGQRAYRDFKLPRK